MALWKYAAVAAIAIVPTTAQAQDSFPAMDWTGWGATAAGNSVTEDAGRRGGGSYRSKRSQARGSSSSAARARRQCANAREQAADGLRDARLSQMLTLCNRAGY
jgi:hypothetical protein